MSVSDPNYVKNLLIRAKEQKRYLSARSLTKKTVVPKMTKSRIWKKFYIKVLTNIVLPTILILAILAAAVGCTFALIYVGVPTDVAKLLGPGISMGIPFLFFVMRRLYKESIDEVKSENKELMKDMKGY